MIYVDDLFSWGGGYSGPLSGLAERTGAKNGHRWCHLFSDETDPAFPELHAFALSIGLRRTWFQGDHYDLTPGRRAQALRSGARAVDRHEAVAIWRRTPRARRFRCKACGYATEPVVTPPPACPRCGRSAPDQPPGGAT